MRPSDRRRGAPLPRLVVTLVAAVALLAGAPRAASASSFPSDPGLGVPGAVRGVWDALNDVSSLTPGDLATFVQQKMRGAQDTAPAAPRAEPAPAQTGSARHGVTPRAIPPAGSRGLTVDLADLSRPTLLDSRLQPLTRLPAGEVRLTVPGGRARLGAFSVGSSETLREHLLVLRGNADVYGRVEGNLVAVNGDVVVHPGAVVTGDVLAIRGEVRDEGGEIGGEIRTLGGVTPVAGRAESAPRRSAGAQVLRNAAGVLGLFVTFAALGFGLVLFGRPNLEIVSDTVTHSFGRSFVTGLVGQLLLVPTLGMIVVGLVLSVVGVLLLPFALVIYGLLAVVGVVGGTLAVLHAMGETYTRRRLARGEAGSQNSYGYIVTGLLAVFALWAAWALFDWVPVAGTLIQIAAILVTWLLATVGFGAALLSRAGVRENFAGRIIPPEALTDEYLWATPQFGVPAVRRPTSHRTPPPRS